MIIINPFFEQKRLSLTTGAVSQSRAAEARSSQSRDLILTATADNNTAPHHHRF